MGFVTKEDLTSILTNLNTKLRKKPTAVELTQAQYDVLTSEQKHDTSKTYYVTDGQGGGSSVSFNYTDITSQISAVVKIAMGSLSWYYTQSSKRLNIEVDFTPQQIESLDFDINNTFIYSISLSTTNDEIFKLQPILSFHSLSNGKYRISASLLATDVVQDCTITASNLKTFYVYGKTLNVN